MSTIADPEQVPTALAAITADLAGTGVDRLELLERVTTAAVQLSSAVAAGLMVADPRGGLTVLAASDEKAEFVEVLQAQFREGPCAECIVRGQLVISTDLGAERRWPVFTAAAVRAGYSAVAAVPLRLQLRTVGGLNLFFTAAGSPDIAVAAVLADLSVIALTQDHAARREERFTETTVGLINDRVLIGHAVGLIAGTVHVDPDTAHALLKERAHADGLPLRQTARAVTKGSVDPAEFGPYS